MKNIIYLLFFLLFSCSEGEGPVTGKWKVVHQYAGTHDLPLKKEIIYNIEENGNFQMIINNEIFQKGTWSQPDKFTLILKRENGFEEVFENIKVTTGTFIFNSRDFEVHMEKQ